MNVGGSNHPIKYVLRQEIAGCASVDAVVERVMQVLHEFRLVAHRDENDLPMLTPAGRIMVDLAHHPDSSLRELAQRQGTTESSVTKQMTHLVEAGLVQRTRLGKRNHYSLNLINVLRHSDIASLLDAILKSPPTPE